MKISQCVSKLRTFICVYLIVAFAATSGWAATYYVDSSTGKDSNPGTQAAPWKSVYKVVAKALQPGDTVKFKAGGVWNERLYPASGVSGFPVAYGSYGTGDKPSIRAFDADRKSYVQVSNIEFRNSTYDHPVRITNSSHHISLTNCDIIADTANSTWAALYILNNSHHNVIDGCNIKHLNTTRQNDAINLRLNSNYNLIKNNTIGSATHYALSLEGNSDKYPTYICNYNVIINNIIYNPNGAQLSLQSEASNNLVDGNTIIGGRSTGYCNSLPRSFKIVTRNNIIRRNIVKDNSPTTASGMGTEVYAYQGFPANQAIGNRIYNNVSTKIYRYPVVVATNGETNAVAYNNVYKNNAIYDNISTYQAVIQINTQVKENYFKNNLFYKKQ